MTVGSQHSVCKDIRSFICRSFLFLRSQSSLIDVDAKFMYSSFQMDVQKPITKSTLWKKQYISKEQIFIRNRAFDSQNGTF